MYNSMTPLDYVKKLTNLFYYIKSCFMQNFGPHGKNNFKIEIYIYIYIYLFNKKALSLRSF